MRFVIGMCSFYNRHVFYNKPVFYKRNVFYNRNMHVHVCCKYFVIYIYVTWVCLDQLTYFEGIHTRYYELWTNEISFKKLHLLRIRIPTYSTYPFGIFKEFYCKLIGIKAIAIALDRNVLKDENSKIFVAILQDLNKRQLQKTFLIFSRLIWSLQEAKHKVQTLQNWIPRQRVCDKYWERRLLTENKI